MGIQSGCQKTNYEIFNRRVPNKTVAQAIGTLNQFSTIQKEYHYIVNNPLEPEAQFVETLHFAAEHYTANSKFMIFPLALFPGSQLHQRAGQEGIISPNQTEIFERVFAGKAKRRFDRLGYLTMLLQAVVNLRTKKIPAKLLHGFINFMLAKPVRFCLDTKPFKLSIFGLYLLNRSIHKTVDQLFFRPFRKKQRRQDINNSLANAAAFDPT